MASDMTDKLLAAINSKEFKDYLQCVQKGEGEKVKQLKDKLEELIQNVNDFKKLPKNDMIQMFTHTIKLLELAKAILELESDKKLLTYGAKNCTDELVTFTIYRNKIQKENLEKTQESIQKITDVLQKKKASVKKTVQSHSARKTKSVSAKKK